MNENEKCANLLCGPSIKLFIYKNRSSLICMSFACDPGGGVEGGGGAVGEPKQSSQHPWKHYQKKKGEPVQKFHSLLGSFDDI